MTKLLFLFVTILTFSSCHIQKEMYESGNLKAKGKVKNNEKIGKWKLLYESGNIFQTGVYSNGKKIGQWKIFHENGQLRQIGSFNNGKQTGEWHFFHSNGIHEGIGTLIDGNRIGIWKWYFDNGQIQTERKWRNGKLIEIISCYDGKGNKMDKGSLTNGNGTMKLYDIDGNLLDILNYENGTYIEIDKQVPSPK